MIDSLQIAKYRWEFIRRNDQYRKDWSPFFSNPDMKVAKSLLKKWGFLNFPQSNNFDKSWDEIKRIKGTIWTRELEEYLFWPDLKDLIEKAMFQYSGNLTSYIIEPELLGDVDTNGGVIVSNETTSAKKYYIRKASKLSSLKVTNIPDKITIEIVNFKKYIFCNDIEQHSFRERIKIVVDQQLKLWESASKKLNTSTKRKYRHRFEHYDDHLRIWDLVNQHEKKWKKIAGIVYPKSISVDSDINKVKASYQQACKLIENAKDIFVQK